MPLLSSFRYKSDSFFFTRDQRRAGIGFARTYVAYYAIEPVFFRNSRYVFKLVVIVRRKGHVDDNAFIF